MTPFNKASQYRQQAGWTRFTRLCWQALWSTMLNIAISLLILLVFSSSVLAEYECLETSSDSTKRIKLDKSFPNAWWRIAGFDLMEEDLAINIAKTYPDYSVLHSSGGYICLGNTNSYVMISEHGFGNSLRISATSPKCNKECSKNKVLDNKLPTMDLGVKIGQSKEIVSKLLEIKITDDVTSIEFQNIEKSKDFEIWHMESLKLTFKENKLVDLKLNDHREGN